MFKKSLNRSRRSNKLTKVIRCVGLPLGSNDILPKRVVTFAHLLEDVHVSDE